MKTSEKNTTPEKGSEKISSGTNISYWLSSVKPITYSSLAENITTEVAIVGAGIAGITIAYCLLKAGKKVIVVDDGNVGSGETGRTTAHLVTALDDRYTYISHLHGKEHARLAAQSHAAAIDKIEEIVTKEKIDCEFKRLNGYLFLDPTDKLENLKDEFEATKQMGLATTWLNFVPGLPEGSGPCIEFENQAQFHPMKYLRGLCDAITKMGGVIYTNTHINDTSEKEIKSSKGFSIKADHFVFATNSPINDMYAMHYKQYPYRTYVIASPIAKGNIFPGLWWDTGNQDSKWITKPYHYVRVEELDEKHDLLICGGEDHRTGQNEKDEPPEEKFTVLQEWAKKHFPSIGKPIYQWSGQVEEPLDSLAFIGRNPGDENIYIATGDSGNGMTHGTIAGMLITDLITRKKNPWEELYDPSRRKLRTADDFIVELGSSVIGFVEELFTQEVSGSEAIPVGEGAIMGIGMNRVAVYREDKKNFHAFSALCPHQKCILEWNTVEKSFDCPCHGSRFTALGKIMNPPAIADLKEITLPKK